MTEQAAVIAGGGPTGLMLAAELAGELAVPIYRTGFQDIL